MSKARVLPLGRVYYLSRIKGLMEGNIVQYNYKNDEITGIIVNIPQLSGTTVFSKNDIGQSIFFELKDVDQNKAVLLEKEPYSLFANSSKKICYPFSNRNSTHDFLTQIGYYYPKYMYGTYDPNPKHDTFSQRILGLKDRDSDDIDYFYNIINPMISNCAIISVMPSCESGNIDTGIRRLAIKLAKEKSRVDATECLYRFTTVESSRGGDRSIDKHLSSILVINEELFEDKVVLLIDDVYTSGNTMLAGEMLLLSNGAKKVYKLVLGRTKR